MNYLIKKSNILSNLSKPIFINFNHFYINSEIDIKKYVYKLPE